MEQHIKQFKELTVEDFYHIVKERIAIFVVEQHCPYQEVDDIDLHALHHYYKDNGEIVAYDRIYLEDDAVHIGRVIVKENYRKSGLGLQLLEDTMKIIKEKFPHQPIEIGAQAHLQHFYNKVGFVAVSDVYLEDDIPHVTMRISAK